MPDDPITRLNAALEGRYRMQRQLGEGGMATVYLADDLRHERKVALKVLKPELAAVVGADRFLAEIKTTANLQHPHILPLFDSGEADSFLFYVMPYVEGESLRERLDREHQLPVDEAVKIATAVANGLDYAHRHGVVHRDIKPANILLHDGEPVVSDFGIALALGAAGAGRLTETGLSLGTPHYMSPEQAMGDVSVGAASDIYALGCVLYELLAGDPPYTASTPQAILGQIVTSEPDSVIQHRKSVPLNVASAIRKAMEKVPADRFVGASDFARALHEPSFRYGDTQARVNGNTGPWKVTALVTGAVALVTSALAAWGFLRPQPSAPVSRYSLALPSDRALAPGVRYTRLAVSPNGDFVYVGVAPDGAQQLWLRPRGELTATPIPGTQGAGNPAFSPDGSSVAFVTLSRGVVQIMVAMIGGGPPLLVEDSLVDGGGLSWGYDGYLYYDGHLAGDGLARVPVGGGTPESVTTPRIEDGEVWHFQPHALPNGRGVLFVSRRGSSYQIAVVDLATGQHKALVEGALAPLYSPTGHLLYVTEDGTLVAVPFDQDVLDITGDPVALAEGVQIFGLGRADLDLAGNGTLLYAAGGGGGLWDVVWVTREGAVSEIDPSWTPGDISQPALSPDNRQLAVTVVSHDGSQIWVKQLEDRGRLSRFTFEGVNSGPVWSPDGRSITYTSARNAGRSAAFHRPADATAPAQLLYEDPSDQYGVQSIAYSNSGEWLVYQGGPDLFRIRLDSAGMPQGQSIPLATSPARELGPALSPDGRWLAYASDESGQDAVYVCPFPSSCDVRYLISTGGGAYPVWSHSGRELFYKSPEGRLMVVEIVPGETFDWSEARALFDASQFRGGGAEGSFDVTQDDQRFVFTRPVGSTNPIRLIVVENFFQVLRERVPID